MANKPYDVVINGMETTLMLSDEDAKLHGLSPSDEAKPKPKAAKAAASKQAPAPQNKGGSAAAQKADG